MTGALMPPANGSDVESPRTGLRGALARAWPALVIAAIVVVGTAGLWLSPGIALFGDWITPAASYVSHVVSVWDPFEHNGTISVDFRAAPLFLPLAVLAGDPGTLRFAVVGDAFIIVAVALPAAVAYGVGRRALLWGRPQAVVAAIAYGFNPWLASQVAAGHFGVVIGYSLLPLAAVTALRTRGLRFAVRTGALVAAAVALDVHTAILGAALLVIGRLLRGDAWRARARDLVASAGVAAAAAAYWVLPTALALRQLTYRPGSISESATGQTTLAQQGDLYHVLAGRSIWYLPFSEGLFDFGVVTTSVLLALLLLPLLVIARALTHRRSGGFPFRLIGVVLVLAGVVPQLVAHYLPAVYAGLGNLPLGAAFRDPSEFTPLYVLGLGALAASVRQWRRLEMGVALVSCAAMLAPWATTNLKSNLQPVSSADSTIAAITWVHAHSQPDERVLWLPPDLYQVYAGANFPVNDPVRFWSPEHLLNPVYDAAYDFSPQLTSALINLQSLMAEPQPGRTLADLTLEAGVRYVVVRSGPGLPDVTHADQQTLALSEGFRLAQSFSGLEVYEAEGTPRHEVTTADTVAVFDGSWAGLAGARAADPGLQRVYVPLSSDVVAGLANRQDAGIALRSNVWDGVYGLSAATPAPGAAGRDNYPFDPGLGYLFNHGEAVTVPAPGVAAFRVLTGDGDVSFECNGHTVGPADIISRGEPEVNPRWISFACNGTARMAVVGRSAFLQGTEVMRQDELDTRFVLLRQFAGHDGSTYSIGSPGAPSDLVALAPASSGGFIASTRRENPLILATGTYRLTITCAGECPPGSATLAPIGRDDWAGRSAQSLKAEPDFGGQFVNVAVTPGQNTVVSATVHTGVYQVLLKGITVDQVVGITLARTPLPAAQTAALPPLVNGAVNPLPGAAAVAVNQVPGPWAATTPDGRDVRVTAADVVGSAYLAPRSAPITLSLSSTTLLEYVGVAVSLAVVMGVVVLEILGYPEAVTARIRRLRPRAPWPSRARPQRP